MDELKETYIDETIGKRIFKPVVSSNIWKDPQPPENLKSVSFNLNKPITWEDFKKLHKSTKKLYIDSLRERFSATNTDIAKMMNIDNSMFGKVLKKNGISSPKRKHKTSEQLESWNAFIGNTVVLEDTKPITSISDTTQNDISTLKHDLESVKELVHAESDISIPAMASKNLHLHYEGELSRKFLCEQINALLPEGVPCEVQIIFTAK